MALDLNALRADTPGLQHGTHMLACGSALMPQVVVDAITDHIQLEARIGGYEAAAERSEMLDGVYDDVARLLGAKPQEIALMENATAAWCQVFYGLKLKAGDRVLTCQAEYAANYVAYLQRAERDGIIIEVIPNDESGAIDLSALETMLSTPAALISITWVPTNGGLVNPAAGVGQLARKYGVPYLLDACQAVGQMPVDVAELGCDFLSATGRKFLRGPRGTGFLYVREDMIAKTEPAVIDLFAAPWVGPSRYELRADARRFENWENAYALRAGLGAAVRYALGLGMDAIQDRAWGLADRLRDGLRQQAGVTLHDAGDIQCAIVSFSITATDSNAVAAYIEECGVSIGTSTPSSTLLDAEARKLPTMLRAAPHYYNSEEEVDHLLACLRTYCQTAS